MIEHVVYTAEAQDDVANSYHWYESLESGLGEDFLRCVEACVLTIQRHPHLYPVATDDFRRALVRRFPYEIFYEPSENSIIVYAVFIVPKILKNGVFASVKNRLINQIPFT